MCMLSYQGVADIKREKRFTFSWVKKFGQTQEMARPNKKKLCLEGWETMLILIKKKTTTKEARLSPGQQQGENKVHYFLARPPQQTHERWAPCSKFSLSEA